MQGANKLRLKDRDMKWKLTNTGADDITIARVQISWPDRQGKLKGISLDGHKFWKDVVTPSYADIDSGWSKESALTLSAGETETLDFDFGSKYKKDKQSDYSITVYFNEGCSVQF